MQLVNWPGSYDDSEYRDTGEGGLFAYAVWNLPPKNECTVDTAPALAKADVLVDAIGPLFTDFAHQSRGLSRTGDFDLDEHNSEISLGTVVFLGSTGASLYDEHDGDYFKVVRESLTEDGTKLVNTLTNHYGTEPTFVTYLDT